MLVNLSLDNFSTKSKHNNPINYYYNCFTCSLCSGRKLSIEKTINNNNCYSSVNNNMTIKKEDNSYCIMGYRCIIYWGSLNCGLVANMGSLGNS